jgi:hypothetical protein
MTATMARPTTAVVEMATSHLHHHCRTAATRRHSGDKDTGGNSDSKGSGDKDTGGNSNDKGTDNIHAR